MHQRVYFLEHRKLYRFRIYQSNPIKKLYSVAASFKPIDFNKFGFMPTEVVFDYSKPSLV